MSIICSPLLGPLVRASTLPAQHPGALRAPLSRRTEPWGFPQHLHEPKWSLQDGRDLLLDCFLFFWFFFCNAEDVGSNISYDTDEN